MKTKTHRLFRYGWWVSILACGYASHAHADWVEIELAGLDDELAGNARAHMSIRALAEKSAQTELAEARVRRLHSDARAEIAEALRPYGYYAPVVRSELTRLDDHWVARYDVALGEPTRLAVIEIAASGSGTDNASVRGVLENIPLMLGSVLRHEEYEAVKKALFDAAYNSGYIDAHYERAEMRVRVADLEAGIYLTLDTGPRYYFGDIVVEQQILDPDFLDRLIKIEAGDPFNPDELVELQLELGDSGYFSDVTVEVQRDAAVDGRIPVVVHTSVRPNQSFTVGAGYGTDTGPRVRLGVELRRLNRRGHRFSADLRASARENTVAAEYRMPMRRLDTDYVSYRALLGQEKIGDFDTEQLSVGASWNDLWRGMQRRIYLEAQREDFAVGDAETQSETALYPGIQLTAKQVDDPLFTRRGFAWTGDLRAGSEAVLGSTNFARVRLAGDYTHPLGERGRLLLRGEYGALRADDFEHVAPSQRFFTGGDRSVRGYEYQTLSPLDAMGAAVGGRYLLVASVELDYLFWGNYGGAIFYDAGNVGNKAVPDLKHGVGIGFRWRSPVGMVRLDLAHPLDDPDTSVRLHLSIGSPL